MRATLFSFGLRLRSLFAHIALVEVEAQVAFWALESVFLATRVRCLMIHNVVGEYIAPPHVLFPMKNLVRKP